MRWQAWCQSEKRETLPEGEAAASTRSLRRRKLRRTRTRPQPVAARSSAQQSVTSPARARRAEQEALRRPHVCRGRHRKRVGEFKRARVQVQPGTAAASRTSVRAEEDQLGRETQADVHPRGCAHCARGARPRASSERIRSFTKSQVYGPGSHCSVRPLAHYCAFETGVTGKRPNVRHATHACACVLVISYDHRSLAAHVIRLAAYTSSFTVIPPSAAAARAWRARPHRRWATPRHPPSWPPAH